MAKGQWRAGDGTVSSPPSGLDNLWTADGQSINDWTIISFTGGDNDQALELSAGTNLRRRLCIPDVTTTGRVDIRGRFRIRTSTIGGTALHFASVRTGGTGASNGDSYYTDFLSRKHRLNKYDGGTFSNIVSEGSTDMAAGNQLDWWNYRYTFDPEGTPVHRFAVWRAHEAESDASPFSVLTSNSLDSTVDGNRIGFGGFTGSNNTILAWFTWATGEDNADSEPVEGGTFTATGALAAGSAEVAGSATQDGVTTHAATGALEAGPATVAGVGVVDAMTLVVDIDAGNVDGASSTITNPGSSTPLVEIEARSAAITGTNGDGWRHLHWAVENAGGRSPTFRLNRATMTNASTAPGTNWRPLWTQDFVSWTRAPSRTLVGGSTGYIEFSFTDPLPSGTVYIATQPLGRQADAVALAADLLSTHSAVAEPTASANSSGVFYTTPAEDDENERAIGENPMHAIKLAWGGSTTDGGPKRKLVMLTGVHSAGENTSWISFRAALDWMLNDASAEADDFRSNWDVYWYGNVSANGLVGGHRRHDFRNSIDKNRDFVNKATAEVSALTTAIESDVGTADALFDWHAFSSETNIFIPGTMTDPNQETLDFISIGETIFGATAVDYFENIPGGSAAYGYNILGCKVAFATEVPQRGDTDVAQYEFIGESWTQTLQAADADGMFYTPPFVAVGELSAQPALVAGSASRSRRHTASGDLQSQPAEVAGEASRTRVFTASGAIAASRASVAGGATLRRLHSASGALSSGASDVSGSGTRTGAPTVHTATGAAASQSAAVNGSASRVVVTHSASGSITAAGATVDGVAARARAHAAEGAVQAGPAVMAGSAERTGAVITHSASGAIQSGSSAIVGAARAITTHSSSGDLVCGSAIVTGEDGGPEMLYPMFRTMTIPGSRTIKVNRSPQ